jgi:signal transduction histidine kinase
MKDRVKDIGGTIETISPDGEGTLIKFIRIAPPDENLV